MCFIVSVGLPTASFFAMLLLSLAASKLQFTSPYQGQTITGSVGSSVKFTWRFSGNVGGIDWGLKHIAANDFQVNGILVSLDRSGSPLPIPVQPQGYNGRVSGSRSGNSSSGQVIFTLSAITVNDAKSYGCMLRRKDPLARDQFDYITLAVEEPPKIIHPAAANASYNEGTHVTISCTARGIPDPDVKWVRNTLVKSSGAKKVDLTLSSIGKDDAGMYTCRANNSVGSDEKRIELIVKYAAIIKSVTPLSTQSWIGQTVTLKCVADGVPTPSLTWKKPNGREIKRVIATENTVNVVMKSDQDFGRYTCEAKNVPIAAAASTVQVKQTKAPGSPTITVNIQATSITVSWTAPADGGSTITGYRVVILQDDTAIRNETTTATEMKIGGLIKSTNYTVKVYARNKAFYGEAGQKIIKTKYEGPPEAVEITDLPSETKEAAVTLTWNEPRNNGAPITHYTVYQKTVSEADTPRQWNKVNVITDVSLREFNITLQKGKNYEFIVTATNKFGESLKEKDKINKLMVFGDVPSEVFFTYDVKNDKIILKWKEPNNNGAVITKYFIYQRSEKKEQWTRVGTITSICKREYVVSKVEEGRQYEFVVTAINQHGESSKKASNINRIKVPEASTIASEGRTGSSCDDEKKTLHIVYITVILLLLISNLVTIFLLWRMRSRSENSGRNKKCSRCGDLIAMNPILKTVQVEADTQSSGAAQTVDVSTYATAVGADYMPLHPSTRSWEVSREQVDIVKVIGKGAFSQVAKATVGNLRGNQETITVAVKMLKANAPASDKNDLLSELELMKKLKPHPHVIKLMGCVTESDPLLVLIEYVPFGDLLGYLRKSRGLNDTYFKDPDVKPQSSLTAQQLMKFAWQVADGMSYLSSKKIIHRDLAARNVLVGEGEKCKVTDFGMARNVQQDDIYNRTSRGRLPVKWTAYEALMYGTYTTQSDVWSYGILLYEILTVGGSPYPDINPRDIARKLQEGYRMPKPRHVESKLYQIMLRCWEENPVDRLTFDKLRKTTKEIERNHKTYVNLNQYDHSLYANVKDLTAE